MIFHDLEITAYMVAKKKRGIQMASKCQCCIAEDSVDHIFALSTRAISVWSFFAGILGINLGYDVTFSSLLLKWFTSAKGLKHSRMVCHILWFIIYGGIVVMQRGVEKRVKSTIMVMMGFSMLSL
ncbi:hypothetical protein LIER_34481 [Lithospermum erythrorhizon]|uniref:Uncharacterized protein n=1 Tax=Lithospermum erythrorhizon TaxID=34254 RepID=A0AAV3S1G8_LITER